jgi:hypothetical protein
MIPPLAAKPVVSSARSDRKLSIFAWAVALSIPAASVLAQPAPAAPAATEPAATPPAAAAPTDTTAAAAPTTAPAGGVAPGAAAAQPADPAKLADYIENYWHFSKVARYDLANMYGQQVLAVGTADPQKTLQLFEETARRHEEQLQPRLAKFQNVDQIRDTSTKIAELLNQGSYARRTDANWIRQNIERLSVNERGYNNGLVALRQSGELAVPIMIDYLRDPSKTQFHNGIRRALRDMGQLVLNPLVAATEMKDNDTLITIIGVLGELRYPASAPYLARLVNSNDYPPAVKQAANQALGMLSLSTEDMRDSVPDMFYKLGDQLYYGRGDIKSDTRNPTGSMWYWATDKGLYRVEVPHQIFNDLMAMRESEYAMKLGGTPRGDALSLWLAGNYKREVDLPEGQKDMTRAENQPDANYYGVTAGSQYLNNALARALRDGDSAVALKIVRSLNQIAGLQAVQGGGPLVDAMSYPDRLVRFDAAFALASALPQQRFSGQERVVPLLAEALNQTGQGSVVVAMPTQDAANALVEGLKQQGLQAAATTNAEGAAGAANAVPAVDVIIISEDLGPEQVEKLLQLASSNPKLRGATKLIITNTNASPYESRKINDRMLATTVAKDAASLKPALDEARKHAGALALTPELATQYAMRAAELLRRLAIARSQTMDPTGAKAALLAALDDARPDIVKISGEVLGLIDAPEAQPALLAKAQNEQTADDVKISLYNSLATSAKNWGNRLDENAINTLSKTVAEAANLQVRSAAAEARGALNLPPDQAKKLIVDQARV